MINITKPSFLRAFIKFPKRNILVIIFLIGFGEWFISDVIHFSGGSLGFVILCLGGYFYLRNEQPKFNEPKDLKGWLELCNDDIRFFEELEEKNNLEKRTVFREKKLAQIINKEENHRIFVLGSLSIDLYSDLFNKYLSKINFELNVVDKIPSLNSSELLSDFFLRNDAIFYHLNLPLTAKGLLWLKKIPNDMPIWLLVSASDNSIINNQLEELKEEIPEKFMNRIIKFDTDNLKFSEVPFNFRKFIFNPKANMENTKKRLLRDLHINWQSEIEAIRRIKLKSIQKKNQLIVAASVFASPIPSIDVLSMTILNALMIKEIKETWGCNWSPEILEKVSKQIIKTAIAQGVVEWSGQTLLNFSKYNLPNMLVLGSLQALSAAYLTRVVSRSLADFLAISKGVSEPDLEFIKSNSDRIVENAFESEKIHWKSLVSDFQNPLRIKLS